MGITPPLGRRNIQGTRLLCVCNAQSSISSVIVMQLFQNRHHCYLGITPPQLIQGDHCSGGWVEGTSKEQGCYMSAILQVQFLNCQFNCQTKNTLIRKWLPQEELEFGSQ